MASMRGEIYRCSVCGNIVEVLFPGEGILVCSGKPMELLKEKSEDQGMEKHVPVIEKTGDRYKVMVGSVPHPMEEKHFIQWIELIADGVVYRRFLSAGLKPEAEFCVKAEKISAREYCNLHGLWKSK